VTGDTYPSSGGFHLYIPILDGTDIPRFMTTLQERCWLAGLADYWVAKQGKFLEYSLIDTAVAGPERPIFEANPKVIPPLQQGSRPAVLRDGYILDTRKACLDLSTGEQETLSKLKAAAKKKLKPEADAAREHFIAEKTREAEERGMDPFAAREAAEQFAKRGVLYPGATIDFVNADLGVVDVAEILADPERFDKKKCWDPVEGRAMGIPREYFMPTVCSFTVRRTAVTNSMYERARLSVESWNVRTRQRSSRGSFPIRFAWTRAIYPTSFEP
jgi:hypothetical protein